MRWQKLGQIFDIRKHQLPDNGELFCKSPQAVEFSDFVRIYFTSQKKTENGKWFSSPFFVDYKKDFSQIIRISENKLIEDGALGAFDEHGIFPINILKHQDKILAYTCGWSRRSAVSIDMSIGLAESFDQGQSFVRYGAGGPVMSASLHEPFMVGDPFVKIFNEIYHMWYIYGTEWKEFENQKEPDRIYKIAHATSQDGIHWKRNGNVIIEDVFDDECQALPTVLKIKNRYHMYFCFRKPYDFRSNPAHAYRLGYAYSDDLQNWTRADDQAGIQRGPDVWDADMMCYPNLFSLENSVYLLYNGNEFGKFGFGLAKLISDEDQK